MKLTMVGTGYVGLVTGACFAEAGNNVVCVDIDAGKVARLQQGDIPIHEPGLDVLVKRNFEKGRLKFTTDAEEGIRHGLFQFIAVGTPPEEDGSADLSHVLAVAETIGRHMNEYRIVVDKSTVPVGTADRVRERIEQLASQRPAPGSPAARELDKLLREANIERDLQALQRDGSPLVERLEQAPDTAEKAATSLGETLARVRAHTHTPGSAGSTPTPA